MAIAEMSRMTLVGLKSDKNEILDALQRTGAAQITPSEEYELAPHGENGEGVVKENALVLRAEHVLEYLTKELDDAPKALRGDGVAKDGIGVTSQQFFAVGDAQEEYEKILSDVEQFGIIRRASGAENVRRLRMRAGQLCRFFRHRMRRRLSRRDSVR